MDAASPSDFCPSETSAGNPSHAADDVRPAAYAGSAYYADAELLAKYIDEVCVGPVRGAVEPLGPGERPIAIVSPHIDPWRGAVGYGHAYAALAASLAPDVDTFVLFGTSHAPMREPFALCRRSFATPLGNAAADFGFIDALAERARGFDPYADDSNHDREHSLEFQAVFLKHALGDRPFRIVPILAGLGEAQFSGRNPEEDPRVTQFLAAVRDLTIGSRGRVVMVAGADMAHVGPSFGDPRPYGGEARARLERRDRESLQRAVVGDSDGFWDDVTSDLDDRRVCGLAPIWSVVRCLPSTVRGKVLHYEQTVDPYNGSIVSHAAVMWTSAGA